MNWVEVTSLVIAIIALAVSWVMNRKYLRIQERLTETEHELLRIETKREQRLDKENASAELFARLRIREGKPELMLVNQGKAIAEGIEVMLVDAEGNADAAFTSDVERYLPLNHLDAGQTFSVPLEFIPALPLTAEMSWVDPDGKKFRPQRLSVDY